MSPDAVYPDASRERIVAAGDRLGHFAATASVLERDGLLVGRQDREKTSIDFRTGAARGAAQEDDRIVRLGGIDKLRRGIVARLFACAGEYTVERIVVGRADRIEFVIM